MRQPIISAIILVCTPRDRLPIYEHNYYPSVLTFHNPLITVIIGTMKIARFNQFQLYSRGENKLEVNAISASSVYAVAVVAACTI